MSPIFTFEGNFSSRMMTIFPNICKNYKNVSDVSKLYVIDNCRDVDGKTSIYWLNMTTFGDHQLHHLFPTVDHSKLPLLYPLLEEVQNSDSHLIFSRIKEFGLLVCF